jgi:hypothetical protein
MPIAPRPRAENIPSAPEPTTDQLAAKTQFYVNGFRRLRDRLGLPGIFTPHDRLMADILGLEFASTHRELTADEASRLRVLNGNLDWAAVALRDERAFRNRPLTGATEI